MFIGATRKLFKSTGGESAGYWWMARISARIPTTGVSGSQLQALLEDEFPAFSPMLLGAVTLKEAVQQRPDLFQVEEGNHLLSKWYVRPVHNNSLPGAATLPSHPSKTQAALQKIQQFCSRRARQGRTSYTTLERVMAHADVDDVTILDELLRRTNHDLDVQAGVRIKPKRIPRSIVAFVDGDSLPAVAVNEMCNEMNVLKDSSTVMIVRQSGSHALSKVDLISPDVIPTYLCIEKHARELRLRKPDVRQDVVYMCSAAQFPIYAAHVAPLNPFPDADVFVCCPSKIALVQPKEVIPLV
ncbi:putative mitochondrial mRNA processing protein [Leptomonas pyrrhocoris]|uniref:Putative mitochondrial mRNA processing protein n=1 Tax=Leptomonas pyrrhocoris TaxID=157538 RepID=A0A0M9FSL4_LEPPY|nr:putative mitochondrial mRNA processing protein [Leptomonas pyrrhocoris]KPA75193.1 putative mitochondrial mRNA processing protein [Leptomonas pyrrhocoris]|eukprot:XP_015653632.1 putative mitochondrial mRNA processing protein [Leptomonas pyrrhocoris]